MRIRIALAKLVKIPTNQFLKMPGNNFQFYYDFSFNNFLSRRLFWSLFLNVEDEIEKYSHAI